MKKLLHEIEVNIIIDKYVSEGWPLAVKKRFER